MTIPLTTTLVTYYTEILYHSHILKAYVTSSVTIIGVFPIVKFLEDNNQLMISVKDHMLVFEREKENKLILIQDYSIRSRIMSIVSIADITTYHKIRLPTTAEIIKYSLA